MLPVFLNNGSFSSLVIPTESATLKTNGPLDDNKDTAMNFTEQ